MFPVPALGLSPDEKKAVEEFLAAVRQSYGDKIQRAALFGSKIGGQAGEYSDIDILLIVRDDDWKFRREISRISSGIALKFDTLLDIRIISVSRWSYMADIQSGLYQNISRDAVDI